MHELNFVASMVEEQLVKGNLRWLANFSEVRRDYTIGDIVFPIYASGSLQERGFLLSRLFSALVTPRYKIHFLLYTSTESDPKLLRRIILSCKSRFGTDDWIFLSMVQNQPIDKDMRESIINVSDKTVGIAAFSLASKEAVTSNNVLGKGLARQLKLTEAKFEAIDLPNYLKSFTITFGLGTILLVAIRLLGVQQAIQPLTLLFMAALSAVVGYRVYKSRYHMILSLTGKGFTIREGTKMTERKWSDYTDVTIHIAPNHETCIRLNSKEETFDLSISRTGIPRKEAYSAIRQLVKRK